MFTHFLWNGKKLKIALKILQANKKAGGAKLVDLKKKDQSLKISWISILENDPQMSTIAYSAMNNAMNENLWKCNLHARDVKWLKIPNKFWRNVVEDWCEYNYKVNFLDDKTILLWNSEIRIQDRPFFWKKCYERGLLYLSQLVVNGIFVSVNEAYRLFGMTIMEYNSVLSGIPGHTKRELKQGLRKNTPTSVTYNPGHIYQELTFVPELMKAKHEAWEKDLQKSIGFNDFLKAIEEISIITNITTFRSFQYRLVQRGLITNKNLFRWKMRDDPYCHFCSKNKETILHLFIYCEKVANFWMEVEQYMREFTPEQINFDVDAVIFNRIIFTPKGHIKNFLCLVATQFIYRQKVLKF